MGLWRYTAIRASAVGSPGRLQRGVMVGERPEEVRSALRGIGLQVLDLRPTGARPWPAMLNGLRGWWWKHQRRRRAVARADLLDGLATLLDTGMPLLDALSAMAQNAHHSRAPLHKHRVLLQVRETVQGGGSLKVALEERPEWFDPVECAMVGAGEAGSTLSEVLRHLAERQHDQNALGQKVIGSLAYPSLVLLVGLGVWMFLSTHTLPEFQDILLGARVEVPALTQRVMGSGQWLARWWWALGVALAGLTAALAFLVRRAPPEGWLARGWRRLTPRFLRRAAVGSVARSLAELLDHGVNLVDALPLVVPTARGTFFRSQLQGTIVDLEDGRDVAAAFRRVEWFDAEFCQLVETGEQSGELPRLLCRAADRYERSAERLLNRLATILEPVAILLLAALVGTVVLAAVLPMLSLQEILQ